MKKQTWLVLSITFITIVLLGCKTGEETIRDSGKSVNAKQTGLFSNSDLSEVIMDKQSEVSEKLQLDGEIIKVSFSNLKENDKMTFEDKKSIEIFNAVFTSAVKVNGIVNITTPEIKIDLVFANENMQSFYLWIGQIGEKSTLMKTDDTHTIYTVSEEMTDKLNELIVY